MSRLRILVADDHTLLRHGLRKILERQPGWSVVAEAGNGREAVRLASELQPDIALLDIAMPELNGIEASRQISRAAPRVSVLVLSSYSHEAYVQEVLQAGARGYLLKDCADTDLIRAISEVAGGKSFFSPVVARVMLDDYVREKAARGPTEPGDGLTTREREVLQLVAEGRTSKEIASRLGLSTNTVESHRSRIMEKLGLRNTAELVRYAARRGIIA